MDTKEKFVFDTKEAKKVIGNFRKQLKKEDMKMRVMEKTHHYQGEQRMEVKLFKGYRKIHFLIRRITEHIMNLDLGYSTLMSYDMDGIVEFAKNLAKVIGSSTIIIQGQNLKELLTTKQKELNKENFVQMFVTRVEKGENIFYINLEKNYVENKLAIRQLVDEHLEKYAEIDKTFVYEQKVGNRDYLITTYYYKGFEGELKIFFGKTTQFHVPQLGIKKEIQTPNEIISLLDYAMEESCNNIKLVSLINPPKKHFREFFIRKIKDDVHLSDDVFSLISEEIPAEQIEEDILDSKKHEFTTYLSYNEFQFFKLFNFYFVLDKQEKQIEKIYEFETAKEIYREKILKKIHDEYLCRLSREEERISSIHEGTTIIR